MAITISRNVLVRIRNRSARLGVSTAPGSVGLAMLERTPRTVNGLKCYRLKKCLDKSAPRIDSRTNSNANGGRPRRKTLNRTNDFDIRLMEQQS